MTTQATENGLLLPGLDGTNPLGFLAALGVLRILTLRGHSPKMRWTQSGGVWRPAISGLPSQLPSLETELHDALASLDHSAWSISKKLPFEANIFRNHVKDGVWKASVRDRQLVDLLASFGAEFFEDDGGAFEETELCMVRSGDAAGQGMIAYGRRIIETSEPNHIKKAIEANWLNSDDKCALRLDPGEDKPYGLQWQNPSSVGAMSEKGANCLALLALPCFPVIPTHREAKTVGFGLRQPKQSSFTWPIWDCSLNLNVVCSILALDELQRPMPERSRLNSMGIAAVYRCDRVMTSKYYANFTPARQLC
ncbi:MAG: hypothetical protein N2039_06375 [Gemmataceae bacterium]|nr:hypothetical protein [Gemmataceae bacterium]